MLRSSLEQAQLESGGIEGAAGSRVGKAIVHVIRSSLSGTAFILYVALEISPPPRLSQL